MHAGARTSPITKIAMEQVTLANVSKYLTLDVINEVFKSKTNNKDEVKSVEITRAAPVGEGMLSAVYRLKVTGNIHTESFIVKGLVQDTVVRESIASTIFFRREGLFFSKILPVLVENQKALGAKENIQDCIPVCYASYIDGKEDYILMEDLSVRNLKSVSTYPTKHERDALLKVLAHFHSVSLALRVKKPDIFSNITNELNEVYYSVDNRDWYAKYLQNALAIDKKAMAEIEDTNGKYYKKFEEFINEDLYGHLVTLTTTRGDHPVINHGDAWYPNFLYCKGNAVVIDFQIVRCVSPATDLSYFIILCSNLCTSKENFFEAVNVYYKALEYYLKDMGIDANDVFSLDTLKEELIKVGRFGLIAALTALPLLSSERFDVLQSSGSLGDDEMIPLEVLWQLSPLKSKEDKQRLVNAVRVAVDVGLI